MKDDDRDTGGLGISDRLTFLLIGAGFGAILALLFAPKPGIEVRGDIADATRKGIDRSREAAQQMGERAGEYYGRGPERVGEYYEKARARAAKEHSGSVGDLSALTGKDDTEEPAGEQSE